MRTTPATYASFSGQMRGVRHSPKSRTLYLKSLVKSEIFRAKSGNLLKS